MDNTEAVFLESIRQNPDDDTARLIYADWLDERGDVRGEWLRVEAELRTDPPGIRFWELRRRFKDLSRSIDRDWLANVSRTEVTVCRERVMFRYECPKHWWQLTPTDQASVRYCEDCSQSVHFSGSLNDVRFHVEREHCVAITPDADRWAVDDMVRADWGRGNVRLGFTLIPADPTPLPSETEAQCNEQTEQARAWEYQHRPREAKRRRDGATGRTSEEDGSDTHSPNRKAGTAGPTNYETTD
jgi:uncharacterized protein (TIGR02996 family)